MGNVTPEPDADMIPKIVSLPATTLVGMRIRMFLSQDGTRELWQKFMPMRNVIRNRTDVNRYYSMKRYPAGLELRDFTRDTEFEKWAAVAVNHAENIPEGMAQYELPGGRYAVFIHKGPASGFSKTLQYIFETWLPGSGYQLDQREHFELLEESYQANDPDAMEEAWIPVRQ